VFSGLFVARTRIKICGITRPEDARAAIECGADALGLVFYPNSSRYVTVDQAREIAAVVPPFVTLVALFVDESREVICQVLEALPVGLIQFHGSETVGFCRQFQRPWMKAVRVKPGMDIAGDCETYRGASGVLLDAFVPGVPGGTGKTFDWTLAEATLPLPWVLAGGLDATNVGEAVRRLRPHAVDVSGGVEASAGIKDREKIGRFVDAVVAADLDLDGNSDE
jgi:phosphoribosylanthranilate isomerase